MDKLHTATSRRPKRSKKENILDKRRHACCEQRKHMRLRGGESLRTQQTACRAVMKSSVSLSYHIQPFFQSESMWLCSRLNCAPDATNALCSSCSSWIAQIQQQSRLSQARMWKREPAGSMSQAPADSTRTLQSFKFTVARCAMAPRKSCGLRPAIEKVCRLHRCTLPLKVAGTVAPCNLPAHRYALQC